MACLFAWAYTCSYFGRPSGTTSFRTQRSTSYRVQSFAGSCSDSWVSPDCSSTYISSIIGDEIQIHVEILTSDRCIAKWRISGTSNLILLWGIFISSIRLRGTVSTLTDRRFLALCAISAFTGVLSAIWLFPNNGLMVYVLPIVILGVLMFADGYMNSQ
jgi:hypothetical protein